MKKDYCSKLQTPRGSEKENEKINNQSLKINCKGYIKAFQQKFLERAPWR